MNTARRQMPHNNSIFCILHIIIAVLDVFISRLLTLHFPRWFFQPALSIQWLCLDSVNYSNNIFWNARALLCDNFCLLLSISLLAFSVLHCLHLAHCRVSRHQNELQQPADDVPWAGQQPWLQWGGGLQLLYAAAPGWSGVIQYPEGHWICQDDPWVQVCVESISYW